MKNKELLYCVYAERAEEAIAYELTALIGKLREKFDEADGMAREAMASGNLEKAQSLTCRAGGFLDSIGVLEAELRALGFGEGKK